VLPFLTETVAASCRERGAVPQAERLQLLREIPAVGHYHAVRREQPLEAVENPRPIPFHSRSGAMQRAAVFFLQTGDPDHTPPLPCPSGVA
jgi:hypothetical protein